MKVVDEGGNIFCKEWAEMNEEEKKAMKDAFAVASSFSPLRIKSVFFGEVEEPKPKTRSKRK